MSLLVTGSIGIDTVEAPWGKVVDALGGSSIYFSYAASFFGPVRLVGVVGDDCPADFLLPLRQNPRIDLAGLEVRPGSKTFRWHGKYHQDVNIRDTVAVELNVLAERAPAIPDGFRDSQFVFLANTHPALQLDMFGKFPQAQLVVADTMDLWIETERAKLTELMARLDGLVLNDSEARQMTGLANTVSAGLAIAKGVQSAGQGRRTCPGFVIVKKGEHGSLLFQGGKVSALPGYPMLNVVDPTGAGDSFAGAMMGYLADRQSADSVTLRRAMAYGAVTASVTLEDFSLNALRQATRAQIDQRLNDYLAMLAM
jgi:sugar/nucleoside kinase (ribokinase family)